jgi:peptidyl-prolyl cis-trans isomerase C
MRYKLLVLIIVSAIVIPVSGCAKKPQDGDKVLAKVSNKRITLKNFNEKIAKLPKNYQAVINRNKQRFLEDTLMETMLYEDAIRKGVGEDKEVKEVVEEARRKIIVAKMIKGEVDDKIKVDDRQARQYYENRKDTFKRPELWRASHVLVASEGEAQDVLNELSKGTSFEELARSKSIDDTASRGGDVGFFRKGQVLPEFENACTQLKIGEISPIVKSQFGYHVIKLTDKKEPADETFEEAKAKIIEELKREKQKELFNKLIIDLKNKYHAEIEDDAAKTLGGSPKTNAENNTEQKQVQ